MNHLEILKKLPKLQIFSDKEYNLNTSFRINKFDNNILAEEKTDGLGIDINSDKGKSSYTKEEFTEMGLKTAEKIRKMDTKTLIINNIHAQKHNLSMLMSGQLYGFALLNFKGNFDLTKK